MSGNENIGRLADISERQVDPTSLCGSWFHRLESEAVEWQGCVVGEVQPGIYLVQLLDWQTGKEVEQRLVSLDRMTSIGLDEEWRFYDSGERMRTAYDLLELRGMGHRAEGRVSA